MNAPAPLPTNGQSQCPTHVAIIMDGNGRWAKARSLPRLAGHKKGADALRDVMNGCRDLGIRYLTVYAFSSENWKRPALEVNDLMELLRYYLGKEVAALHKNQIRLRIVGDRSKLSADILKQIEAAEALTAQNTAFHLTLALSYGARQELACAAQTLAKRVAAGELSAEAITEEMLSNALYTHDLPEPDLLIRTGGEQRLSNFLLWQSAYTELYFSPVLWPDFSEKHLQEAVEEFGQRERRYGTTTA